jgi:hypothetical protein
MQEKREMGVLFFSQRGERRRHVKIFHQLIYTNPMRSNTWEMVMNNLIRYSFNSLPTSDKKVYGNIPTPGALNE